MFAIDQNLFPLEFRSAQNLLKTHFLLEPSGTTPLKSQLPGRHQPIFFLVQKKIGQVFVMESLRAGPKTMLNRSEWFVTC